MSPYLVFILTNNGSLMGLYSHTVGSLIYWQQRGGGIGGRGLPNERPGSCSCDLRANERPQKKLHSIAQHTTDGHSNFKTENGRFYINLKLEYLPCAVEIFSVPTHWLSGGHKNINCLQDFFQSDKLSKKSA